MKRPPHRPGSLHLPFAVCCALAIATAGGSPAAADVVHLENGQTLRGEVTKVDDQIAIRSAIGEIRLPADLVERIERGVTPEQAALERLERMPGNDVQGRVDLALGLERQGESTLARRIYQEVVEIDPDNPIARRALGYVRCDERWTTEAECRRSRGEVLHDGEWLSADQASLLQTLELQRRQAELDRMRSQLALEAARWNAEQMQMASQSHAGTGEVPFGYPFDPDLDASSGIPFWPTGYAGGFDPFFGAVPGFHFGKGFDGRGRHGFHSGRHGFGARGFHPGSGLRFDHGRHGLPLHHQGGRPARPLVPRHHSATRAPAPSRALPALPSGVVPSPRTAGSGPGR